MKTTDVTPEKKQLIEVVVGSYLVLIAFDLVISYFLNLEMTSLIYFGPYALGIFVCEKLYKYSIEVTTILRNTVFYVLNVFLLTLYLMIVVEKGDIEMDGVGVVILLQMVFLITGCLTARMFQKIRGRKR